MIDPYNPLDKGNLARSIEDALLKQEPTALGSLGAIKGAGIYVLYYSGDFPAYAPLRCDPSAPRFDRPIYIGKAIPSGGRKGGLGADAAQGSALLSRLRKHATSVSDARNLALEDFWVRYLVVDDIWIPLGENALIERFRPLWNGAIDGFGNNDPGRRRSTQYKSPWDVLHPGRGFADKRAMPNLSETILLERVADYLAGRQLRKLPREVIAELANDDPDAAD